MSHHVSYSRGSISIFHKANAIHLVELVAAFVLKELSMIVCALSIAVATLGHNALRSGRLQVATSGCRWVDG